MHYSRHSLEPEAPQRYNRSSYAGWVKNVTLDARGPEFPRKARRQRMGGNGSEHFDEVSGSTEFFIYIAPNMSTKGYHGLKSYLEGLDCTVEFPAVAPLSPGPRHQAVKITHAGEGIPTSGLKRAHTWAHTHSFLHSFFKPFATPPAAT